MDQSPYYHSTGCGQHIDIASLRLFLSKYYVRILLENVAKIRFSHSFDDLSCQESEEVIRFAIPRRSGQLVLGWVKWKLAHGPPTEPNFVFKARGRDGQIVKPTARKRDQL